MDEIDKDILEELKINARATAKNVLECHHIAGNHDYLLKVLVKNSLELEDFLMNTLKQIKGIASTDTIISLSTLKDEINI